MNKLQRLKARVTALNSRIAIGHEEAGHFGKLALNELTALLSLVEKQNAALVAAGRYMSVVEPNVMTTQKITKALELYKQWSEDNG